MELEWCLIRMHWVVFDWNINRFDKTSSNAIGNCLNELFLSWFFGIVNTEDVLSLRRSFEDLLDHTSQISYMNCWHEIFTLSDDW